MGLWLSSNPHGVNNSTEDKYQEVWTEEAF